MEMGDEVAATMEQRQQPGGIRFTSRSLARPDLRIGPGSSPRPRATGNGGP